MGHRFRNRMTPVGGEACDDAMRSPCSARPVLFHHHSKTEIAVVIGALQTCLTSAQLGARRGDMRARKTDLRDGRAQEIWSNGWSCADGAMARPGGETEKHCYAEF